MKKILSLMLSLVMLLSVTAGISFTAQAADGTSKDQKVTISTAGNSEVFLFTPSETGDYYFYTYNSTHDTIATGFYEWDAGKNIEGGYYYDDFFDLDFAYYAHLTKNVRYAVVVRFYSNSATGSFWVAAEKNPIKSVKFTGKAMTFKEFTHGNYRAISETEEAFFYDPDQMFSDDDKIIVTLNNGSTATYTAKMEYDEEDHCDYLYFYDEYGNAFWGYELNTDQRKYNASSDSYIVNPWKVGKHTLQLTFANYEINIPVEITAKGWYKSGSKWYYSKDGADVKGWLKDGNKWYLMKYADGSMITGWAKSGGKWYYMNSSGAMVTGWQKISGKWYWFNSSGAMVTGWQKISGKWYYFNANGDMKTGWLKDGGKWYYLDASGAMLASTSKKIGSKTYKFNASGVCTNP